MYRVRVDGVVAKEREVGKPGSYDIMRGFFEESKEHAVNEVIWEHVWRKEVQQHD